MSAPRIFISYSWDSESHKNWVAKLATVLRSDGVDTTLDQWHAIPGDQLPAFMEKEIRENDYVLVICTPDYRLKSDGRRGGVGYEGDLMTAEVHTQRNHRKFIPILARGIWTNSAPSWLKGKYYVDLSTTEKYETNYSDLMATLLGTRAAPPLLRVVPNTLARARFAAPPSDEPIRALGVIVDEVTEPRLDGTPGSALYVVPFQLNRVPSSLWSEFFLQTWDRPPCYSSMHRPGIATVQGAKVFLDGTTIEEVKKYHRDTLILCVNNANMKENESLERKHREQEMRRQKIEAHAKEVKNTAKNVSFD